MSKLSQAIGLQRESNLLYREAMAMKANKQGRKDRLTLSMSYAMKVRYILGKLSKEGYESFLQENN